MLPKDRKAEVPVQPRQALEGWAGMALFAITEQSEATRGAGHRSWTIKKSGKSRLASTAVIRRTKGTAR